MEMLIQTNSVRMFNGQNQKVGYDIQVTTPDGRTSIMISTDDPAVGQAFQTMFGTVQNLTLTPAVGESQ